MGIEIEGEQRLLEEEICTNGSLSIKIYRP